MPIDQAGHASRPASPMPVTGQTADAPQLNIPVDDIYAILNRMHLSDGRKPFLGEQNFNGYKATGAGDATDAGDLVPLAQVQAMIAAVGGVPTGAMMPMTGLVVPPTWVIANGQTLLRATYPTYWAWVQASGNLAATEAAKTHGQYGPGDGSTTFTVPNLTADGGQFIRPMASGRTIGSVQGDEFRSHQHAGEVHPVGNHAHGYQAMVPTQFGAGSGSSFGVYTPAQGQTAYDGAHSHGLTIAANGGTETRPKNIAYPVLIKT